MKNKKNEWLKGLRDGIPIGLGYLAVAFSLGIVAKEAGITAMEGFWASFFTAASAGEYAVFLLIGAGASYIEVALMTLVANARYMLMSSALSQKFSPDTPFIHRFLVGYGVTDEIFGISIGVPGKLNPRYAYGALLVAVPGWSLGTFLGVLMGNILPDNIVSALSVGLYGMFIAIIVPPARKNKVVLGCVVISMLASLVCEFAPLISAIPSGIRIIILTVVIASVAAILFPVKDDPYAGVEEEDDHAA